jgi:hypothetical protein
MKIIQYLTERLVERWRPQWESLAKLKSEIIGVQADVLELAQEAGSMIIFRRRSSPWKPV